MAELRNETAPATDCMYYVMDPGQEGHFYYDADDMVSSDNTGTVVVSISGARFKRIFNGPVNILWFGAKGDGMQDDAAAVQAALDAGHKTVYVPSVPGSFRLASKMIVSAPVAVVGDGESAFSIDWSAIGNDVVFQVVASGVRFEGLTFTGNETFDPSEVKFVIRFYVPNGFGSVHRCRSTGSNNFVYAYGASCSVSVTNCVVTGMVDGSAQQNADHTAVRISDGERCAISGNRFSNLSNPIIFGLSTNNSVISDNIIKDCANNSIYISSGNGNIVQGNHCEGKYSPIKVRGDRNKIIGNTMINCCIRATNAVVDYQYGYGINSLVIASNNILCDSGAYGLSVVNKDGYPCKARGIVITGNTIRSADESQKQYYGILFQFKEAVDCVISGNTVDGTANRGILANSSPFAQDSLKRIHITNNAVANCGGSCIVIAGDWCDISGNSCSQSALGGSGSGLIRINGSYSKIANNLLQDGASYGINEMAGSDYNLITDNMIADAAVSAIVTSGANSQKKGNFENGSYVP